MCFKLDIVPHWTNIICVSCLTSINKYLAWLSHLYVSSLLLFLTWYQSIYNSSRGLCSFCLPVKVALCLPDQILFLFTISLFPLLSRGRSGHTLSSHNLPFFPISSDLFGHMLHIYGDCPTTLNLFFKNCSYSTAPLFWWLCQRYHFSPIVPATFTMRFQWSEYLQILSSRFFDSVSLNT